MSENQHDTPNLDHPDLLRALGHTLPEAESAFQDNLEEQLMARLSSNHAQIETEENTMQLFNQKQKRGNRRSRLPLTLAAAVIAIAFVGGLLFFIRGTSNLPFQEAASCGYSAQVASYQVQDGDTLLSVSNQFGISVDTLAEANCIDSPIALNSGQMLNIPIENNSEQAIIEEQMMGAEVFIGTDNMQPYEDFSPMVIATRDIAMNEMITADMLTVVLVPWDFMMAHQPPEVSFMNVLSSVDLAIGQVAAALIHAYEPVLMENLREPLDCDMINSDCAVIPANRVAIAWVTDDPVLLAMSMGEHIDVLAAIQYVEVNEQIQRFIDAENLPIDVVPQLDIWRVVSDAILVLRQHDGDSIIITLAVRTQDATVLQYLAESEAPLRFVPHVALPDNASNETSFTASYPTTEDNLAIISIPLEQLHTTEVINGGNILDIHFSFHPNEANLATVTPRAGDVVSDTISVSTPSFRIEDSQVLYVGRGTEEYPNPDGENGGLFIAITVNLRDAWLVDWYVENGAVFSLDVDNIASARQANAGIEITSISGIGNLASESIQIRNTGSVVNLTGWRLEDEDGNVYVFEDFMLFSNAEHTVNIRRGTNTPIESFWGLDSAILEAGERISLYDANDILQAQYEVASNSANSRNVQETYAVAIPITGLDIVSFGIIAGDFVDVIAYNASENNNTPILEQVEVLYIGNNPLEVIPDVLITGEISDDTTYIVLGIQDYNADIQIQLESESLTFALQH